MAAKFITGARPGFWAHVGLIAIALTVGVSDSLAAKLDPSGWQIFNFSGTLVQGLNAPAVPSGVRILGASQAQQTTSSVAQPSNLLTNLTDNNLSTFTTLSNPPVLLIDLAQPCAVDRVLLNGSTNGLYMWPDYADNQTNAPLGLIVVYVGNTPTTTNAVAYYTVPPDAGNPVETEAELRFSPAIGRYVRIELQTQVTWGLNYWPGWALASQPPATNVQWNVGEVELYGFSGTNAQVNADAVVVPSNAAAPLALAASDLSYYLGELEGRPVPIITPASTNSTPARYTLSMTSRRWLPITRP